ncbi:hypothetical protein Ahy_A01g000722 isoform C [Arachis hypogaea]|uniref:Rho GDP-dissociation inhibitor n=1 Tax=Arachis hypogaea TaxID=3818 RepID=A0A445EKZ7_ARAHY|nr:hypothetical protein Ahy_A01g000722 isoform C [Arachis hypogaea]
MSLAIGVASKSSMGFEDKSNGDATTPDTHHHSGKGATTDDESGDERGQSLSRYKSESSVALTEDEEDDDDREIELGPQCTLKEQLEKDKDDESLRRWKEQLLGSVDMNSVGETLEPEVKILSLAIKVSHNIVSGLKYTNTVWKTGIKVDSTKEMIGTFSPQAEPYTHEMPEETTPSGIFARGSYSAKTKFVDDDNKSYLDITYTFDIRKDWQ